MHAFVLTSLPVNNSGQVIGVCPANDLQQPRNNHHVNRAASSGAAYCYVTCDALQRSSERWHICSLARSYLHASAANCGLANLCHSWYHHARSMRSLALYHRVTATVGNEPGFLGLEQAGVL